MTCFDVHGVALSFSRCQKLQCLIVYLSFFFCKVSNQWGDHPFCPIESFAHFLNLNRCRRLPPVTGITILHRQENKIQHRVHYQYTEYRLWTLKLVYLTISCCFVCFHVTVSYLNEVNISLLKIVQFGDVQIRLLCESAVKM